MEVSQFFSPRFVRVPPRPANKLWQAGFYIVQIIHLKLDLFMVYRTWTLPLVLCGLALTGLASNADAAILDLTVAGNFGFLNGGFFQQVPDQSTGTGVIDPFVRIGAANQNIVEGYNTDKRPLQFDKRAMQHLPIHFCSQGRRLSLSLTASSIVSSCWTSIRLKRIPSCRFMSFRSLWETQATSSGRQKTQTGRSALDRTLS